MLKQFQQRLDAHATANPEQLALVDGNMQLTYVQLVEQLSQLIEVINKTSYQRFALDMSNSVNWVIYDLAIMFCQRVCIPIPPFFTPEQRINVLRDSGADVVVLGNGKLQPLAPTTIPELPLHTAKITYTSGSTGAPKGVCLSTDNLLNTVGALTERVGDVATQRHLVIMPLAVLLENVAGVYLSLWLGHEVVLPSSDELGLKGSSGLNGEAFFQALNHYQPQSLILTPALLGAVVQGVSSNYLEATQFKLLAVGGARLPEPLEQKAYQLGLPVVQGYGLSEFGSVVAFNEPNNSVLGSVGKPLTHAKVELKDNEIWVSGSCMLGYLNQPESWYPKALPTGDWGQFDAHGNLHILGRKKNTIVTAYGRNVDPEWLEGLLALEPEVLQVAVLGDEQIPLTALLVLRDETSDAATIIERVNRALPDYAHIQDYKVLTTPFSVANEQLTGTGRLRRDVIRTNFDPILFSSAT